MILWNDQKIDKLDNLYKIAHTMYPNKEVTINNKKMLKKAIKKNNIVLIKEKCHLFYKANNEIHRIFLEFNQISFFIENMRYLNDFKILQIYY